MRDFLQVPANAGVLRYLGRNAAVDGRPPSQAPGEVEQPYLRLGTHPELVERLWDKLGGALPEDCRWVAHGWPVLIHPTSGVIFGFAGGTHAYALRLPAAERAQALAAGAATVHHYPASRALDLADVGPEWVLGRWYADEPAWCLAAYHFAASSPAG